ncbi:hypothetical protein M2480_001151 [Parabacteroides sp. PFB2-12]|uniref:DUF4249 domain-containing protein n=1 Tax=unclassified Parabacteroides TaxID=2649774 RepID=UPI0024740B34|nr:MULTISPECIES: DUF4249 domain-containing protein [unclassified Parabacteroides]MDH6342529.1 hypothetical protein [Parabacteroides sp. PM6-13]MDH6390181.1 hypothetical protein [Parabacteroides sp. PFB2-12]
MKIVNFSGILLLILLIGCIEPYEPKNVESTTGVLVVEGMLLEYAPTRIKLSRTIELDQDIYHPVTADVSILSTQGKNMPLAASEEKGIYLLDTGFTFEEGEQYALEIRDGSELYRSDFVTPVYTPDIDSVSYVYSPEDVEVKINVTTHDPANKQHYYQWAYEEDWEMRVDYIVTTRWDPVEEKLIEDMDLYTSDNRYYCWNKDHSKAFILGNSDRLSDALIKDKTLLTIEGRGYRFTSLYSILVKQYALSPEAYDYFRNLQKNIDDTGSIFAPQPTEMKGNIACITNPERPTIGYFAASVEKRERLYIPAHEVLLPPILDCSVPSDEVFFSFADAYSKGFGIKVYIPEVELTYARLRCVDCTEAGGTKNRPDFWPTNHY